MAPGPWGLLHPFPSALDAMAAGGLAALAGAGAARAAAVTVAMALIQTSIGAANDVLDVEHDRIARPEKPLPSGIVARRAAVAYVVVAGAAGMVISLALGPLPALIAAAGFAAGLVYDAWLSRTAVSWLPFAIGLPLLPAFSWTAARGHLPSAFAGLVVLGALAGAAVALSNGLVDLDADQATGRGGLALQLGRRRAQAILAALNVALLALVAGTALAVHAEPPAFLALLPGALLVLGATVGSRSPRIGRRERAWEAEAVALAVLAVAWIAASEPGLLR